MAAAGNGWKRASAYDMKVCWREEFRGIHAGRQVKTPLGVEKNHSWKKKLNGRAGAKNKKGGEEGPMMAAAGNGWKRASAYDMKVCWREEFRGIHAGRQVKTPLGGKKTP